MWNLSLVQSCLTIYFNKVFFFGEWVKLPFLVSVTVKSCQDSNFNSFSDWWPLKLDFLSLSKVLGLVFIGNHCKLRIVVNYVVSILGSLYCRTEQMPAVTVVYSYKRSCNKKKKSSHPPPLPSSCFHFGPSRLCSFVLIWYSNFEILSSSIWSPNSWRSDVTTEKFPVDPQVDMATWRDVRVCSSIHWVQSN